VVGQSGGAAGGAGELERLGAEAHIDAEGRQRAVLARAEEARAALAQTQTNERRKASSYDTWRSTNAVCGENENVCKNHARHRAHRDSRSVRMGEQG
jgi:hypothetical protein